MTEMYQHGERVDITIRGARVREVKYYGDGQGPCLKFEYSTPNGQTMPDAVFYDQPAVTVERHQEPDPEFPATKAGGHSLVIEYGDEELHGSCQCGKSFGSIRPNQSLDTTLTQVWERHVHDGGAPVTGIKPGDIVDINIKRVRVADESPAGLVTIIDEHGGSFVMPPQAAIERVVPASWPPRAGDLWRDKHGELWFIHRNPYVMQPDPELLGRTTGGARWTDDMDALMEDNAPLSLVHREGGDQR